MTNCHLDSPMNVRSLFLVHMPPASIHFKVFGCISWIYMLCVLKAPQSRVSRTLNFSWFLSPSFLPSHLTSVLTDLLKALILLSFFPSQKPKQGLCSSWPSTASHQFLSMSKVFTPENIPFFSSFLTMNDHSDASPAHPTVRRALVSAVYGTINRGYSSGLNPAYTSCHRLYSHSASLWHSLRSTQTVQDLGFWDGSFLPLCGRSKSGSQTWQQAPWPTKPPCQSAQLL